MTKHPDRAMTIAHSLWLGLGLLGCTLSLGIAPAIAQVSAPTTTAAAMQLVRQARGQYTAGDLEQAETNLRAAADRFETEAEWPSLAATLTNLGRVQYATGRFDPAIATWERAATIYRDRTEDPAAASDLKVMQAEALKELGLYPRACETLIRALRWMRPTAANKPSMQLP